MKKNIISLGMVITIIFLLPIIHVLYRRITLPYGYVDYYIPQSQMYLRLTADLQLWYVGMSKDPNELDYLGKCPETIDFFSVRRPYDEYLTLAYFNIHQFDTIALSGYVSTPYNESELSMVVTTPFTIDKYRNSGIILDDLKPDIGVMFVGYDSIVRSHIFVLGEGVELVEIKRSILCPL